MSTQEFNAVLFFYCLSFTLLIFWSYMVSMKYYTMWVLLWVTNLYLNQWNCTLFGRMLEYTK